MNINLIFTTLLPHMFYFYAYLDSDVLFKTMTFSIEVLNFFFMTLCTHTHVYIYIYIIVELNMCFYYFRKRRHYYDARGKRFSRNATVIRI